ncbi:AbiV family abortive infection protein [Variovorax sp. 770b2]|uniref:AbiV family abortive infection protein n=1 Tax=Variovorax sp. 770b2 TaxID=1566271 RepID=UPI0008E10E7F|nr:AbiV family abortive infection protein [Variovorax sp. 770b2]SFQ41058.1 abortive infection protein, AbiV family [Variovorax sp. 770b2]
MTLIEGAVKTIKNADELFDEARLLADAGRVARALLLHQISLEECGKAELLYVSLIEVLRGQLVDLKQLSKVLARHAAKNKTNAYFLPTTEAEISAGERNDSKASVSAFNELKETFHKESNDLKNASLYVDFDGTFVAPSEVILKEHLAEALDRNGQFMLMAMDKLRLVMHWATDLDAAAGEVAALRAALGMDALDRSKPETFEAFSKRLEGMFAALDKKT